MDHLEQQIQQFWEHQTTPEQRREILRQLEESGLEWKAFMHQYYSKVLAGEADSSLGDDQKRRVWQQLQDKHLSQDREVAKEIPLLRRAVWLPWVAAASLLLIGGLYLFRMNTTSSNKTSPVAITPVAARMIVQKNTGTRNDSLTLPDHSVVLLAPGSSLSYPEHFEALARPIQLDGRALFEVVKDSLRPFTVTARGFSTTALGTRFIVDGSRPLVSIRLLEGKIVVNATADAGMTLQNVYLVPGQELRINTATKRFDMVSLHKKLPPAKAAAHEPVMPLSFEKTPLPTVFQRLGEYHKTTILFDKDALQGLSFTGDFAPSDELELALKVICHMNQLSFTKEHNRIVISKQ